jgi:hypothetical protein
MTGIRSNSGVGAFPSLPQVEEVGEMTRVTGWHLTSI